MCVIAIIGNLISCTMAAYAFARLTFVGRGFWFALMMLILFYLIIPIAPLGRFDPDVYSQINHYTGFYTIGTLLILIPLLTADEVLVRIRDRRAKVCARLGPCPSRTTWFLYTHRLTDLTLTAAGE